MRKTTVAVALALCCSLASAAETYVGVDFGRSNVATSYAGESFGWSLFGGYRLNPHFGAEFGYRRLGRKSVAGAEVEGSALQASLLGHLPVSGDAWLFARLGVNRVQIEARGNGLGSRGHENKVLVGLGAEYRISRSLRLRTEFQKPSDDSNVISIGLNLSF